MGEGVARGLGGVENTWVRGSGQHVGVGECFVRGLNGGFGTWVRRRMQFVGAGVLVHMGVPRLLLFARNGQQGAIRA